MNLFRKTNKQTKQAYIIQQAFVLKIKYISLYSIWFHLVAGFELCPCKAKAHKMDLSQFSCFAKTPALHYVIRSMNLFALWLVYVYKSYCSKWFL